MMLLGGETVSLERFESEATNEHGIKSPRWAAPVEIQGVGVDIPDVSEPRDGVTRNVRFDYRLYFPPGTTVGDRDRVTVRGHRCQVEQAGEPLPNMFTATVFRTEVLVRRVTR
ncbi:hypothetical protein ACUIAC_01030 [Dermabacteraceae bacterium P13138]